MKNKQNNCDKDYIMVFILGFIIGLIVTSFFLKILN